MFTINVRFHNGTIKSFNYDQESLSPYVLIEDIGRYLYPNYNSQVNRYIQLVHLGQSVDPESPIILKSNQTMYCIVKNIPNEVFNNGKDISSNSIQTVTIEEIQELCKNPKFINIFTNRNIFDFVNSNLDNPEKLFKLDEEKKNLSNQENILIKKYAVQLDTLKSMGFINDYVDPTPFIQLLQETNGNIEAVIDSLG